MTQLYNDFEQTVNQVLPFTEYEITPDVMKSYNKTLQEVVQRISGLKFREQGTA